MSEKIYTKKNIRFFPAKLIFPKKECLKKKNSKKIRKKNVLVFFSKTRFFGKLIFIEFFPKLHQILSNETKFHEISQKLKK